MKRVLILDNDPAILEVMQEALGYQGYDVRAIMECEDIFASIAEHQPNVLLIDYILNGVNGGEICAQVKRNAQTADLPVVIMSAYPRIIESLGNYGCDDFIAKPFDLHFVFERLAALTSSNETHLHA